MGKFGVLSESLMLAGLYSFYGSGSSHSSGKSTKTKGSKARRKKAYAARKQSRKAKRK